jgi:hypothetical protein
MGTWITYEFEDDAAGVRCGYMPFGIVDNGWKILARALASLYRNLSAFRMSVFSDVVEKRKK